MTRMMKLTTLGIALLAAGIANAAPVITNSGTQSLTLVVFDANSANANAPAYVRLLGTNEATFLANDASSIASSAYNFATDSNWATFTSLAGSDELKFMVFSGDGAVATKNLLTTVADTSATFGTTAALTNAISNGRTLLNGEVAFGGASNTIASNATPNVGSNVTTSSNTGPGNPLDSAGIVGPSFAALYGANMSQSAAADIGTALSVVKITKAQTPGAVLQGTFSLDTAGNLSYNVAVASVPEPGTWALFGAGILAMGAIARRRVS